MPRLQLSSSPVLRGPTIGKRGRRWIALASIGARHRNARGGDAGLLLDLDDDRLGERGTGDALEQRNGCRGRDVGDHGALARLHDIDAGEAEVQCAGRVLGEMTGGLDGAAFVPVPVLAFGFEAAARGGSVLSRE